ADIKKTRSDQKLILVGCFAERHAAEARAELPEVDLWIGTGRYGQAGEIIRNHFGAPADSTGESNLTRLHATHIDALPYAPVKLSEGCNRGCAFCSIPQFRGAFQPIATDAIIQECRELSAVGVREVCLVSQDTNRFARNAAEFVDVLERIAELPDLSWIRLLYLYPDPATLNIWKEIARRNLGKVVPYLESPVQHVSGAVLRAMRRYGDYNQFAELFQQIRALFPDLEIRTSFLIGHPGETPQDVALIERFMNEIRPEKVAFFAYSREIDTPGFDLGDPIPAEEKESRINILRQQHLTILADLHRERVGRVYECMLDEVDPTGQLVMRRPQDAPEIDEVVFVMDDAGPREIGAIYPVQIDGFLEYDMTGRLEPAMRSRQDR
ncbi:MAG: radical SAM protein, partial [Leptospiraceae bacterium]|nr:radical SAM protein [Leptospiraceae bacterium]